MCSVCPTISKKNHKYCWMKFPKVQILGNFLYFHTSLDSSVNPSGSLSVTPSLSAENLLKFPGNYGEKNAVNYLHEIPVNIPTVHTSSVMSVITLISASYVPSIHPLDDEGWEKLEQFPSTSYEENFMVVITAKIPDDITLTLHQVKFPEKASQNFNVGNCSVEFPSR